MIKFENVTLARGSAVLFRNLNLHIHEGEHLLIQGENGAGKTLIMEALAGLLAPREGRVHYSFIDGEDWDSRYQQRRERIHYMPAQWLQSALSGTGDHYYQERYYSMSGTHAPAVRDLLGDGLGAIAALDLPTAFDIRALLDLEVTRLSNGQLRKVIILRQLARNTPRVLLLDYPYDGLDIESRNELNDFLDHLAETLAIQIVLVAHGEEVPRCINRRIFVDNFNVQERDSHGGRRPGIPDPMPQASPDPPSGAPVVEMRNLTIAYGGRKIISGLDWRIYPGDRWALTGKNGSGKTTLFSLIFADHPMAYSQEVFLFGRRRGSGESIWDIKQRIQYFGPEQIHFLNARYISIAARDYVAQSTQTASDRLTELIHFFHAEDYIDKPVMHLSSGQLQMIMLIKLFLHRRELLLLDEPFQYLDPGNRERVATYLNHYLSRDITLILISHDERDLRQWTQKRMRL